MITPEGEEKKSLLLLSYNEEDEEGNLRCTQEFSVVHSCSSSGVHSKPPVQASGSEEKGVQNPVPNPIHQ
jgi:hypothetical protein